MTSSSSLISLNADNVMSIKTQPKVETKVETAK